MSVEKPRQPDQCLVSLTSHTLKHSLSCSLSLSSSLSLSLALKHSHTHTHKIRIHIFIHTSGNSRLGCTLHDMRKTGAMNEKKTDSFRSSCCSCTSVTVHWLSCSWADSKQFVLAFVLTMALVDSWNSFNVELANKTILIYEVVCKAVQWILNCVGMRSVCFLVQVCQLYTGIVHRNSWNSGGSAEYM